MHLKRQYLPLPKCTGAPATVPKRDCCCCGGGGCAGAEGAAGAPNRSLSAAEYILNIRAVIEPK